MNDGTLAFCVLINQRERGKAIGIDNDTQGLRGLAAYVRHGQKAQAKGASRLVAQAVWLKAMIEEHTTLAHRLSEHIKTNIDDADTRNEGIYVMTQIDAYINTLNEQLEELWQHS